MKMNSKDISVSEEEIRWTAYLNGEPEPEGFCELNNKEYEDLNDAWELSGTNFSFSAADPDKGWMDLQRMIQHSGKKVRFSVFKNRVFQYAATILLVVGIGFATWQVTRIPKLVTETPIQLVLTQTSAHPLTITKVILPDGSVVRLNADTKIEYPERFDQGMRTVKLSGEAFFEVTKDSVHPFRIETSNASVEVLGTSFNVSAYPNSGRVEVNVETGKVRLTSVLAASSGQKMAILPAGARGWINVSDGESGHEKVLSPNYGSWMTKVITFQRTPLAEVCAVIENTYHIKLKTENSELGKIPYTANFSDLNPDYIIDVIARTHHLRVKKSGDEIILAKSVN